MAALYNLLPLCYRLGGVLHLGFGLAFCNQKQSNKTGEKSGEMMAIARL